MSVKMGNIFQCEGQECKCGKKPTMAYVQSEGGWENGPEEGGIARASSARALAELCAAPELHTTISRSGAARALAEHGAEAVCGCPPLHPVSCWRESLLGHCERC